MLVNKVYIGQYSWKDIKLDDAIPPIITKDTFDKAQRILEMRKHATVIVKPSNNYCLTSKIFCAHCNGPLIGMSGTSKTNKVRHHYYVCSNKKRKKTDCSLPNIPQEYIEQSLAAYLQRILSDEQNIMDIAKYAVKAQNTAQENAELVRLQAEQKELKRKIDNCIKAIENGVISEAIVTRLKESEAAMETIKRKVLEQTMLLHASMLTEAQIVFFLKKMTENISTNISATLNTLVRAVFVEYKKDSDEYIIPAQFNYANTNSLHSVEEIRVRNESPMVDNWRGNENFSLHCFHRYFQISFRLLRKNQRPAI